MFEIGPEFLISVQTGYFSGFPEPCQSFHTHSRELDEDPFGINYLFKTAIKSESVFGFTGNSVCGRFKIDNFSLVNKIILSDKLSHCF